MFTFLCVKDIRPPESAFCNYLATEVKNLEERDFQTVRNETIKLLSRVQSKAGERARQPQQS